MATKSQADTTGLAETAAVVEQAAADQAVQTELDAQAEAAKAEQDAVDAVAQAAKDADDADALEAAKEAAAAAATYDDAPAAEGDVDAEVEAIEEAEGIDPELAAINAGLVPMIAGLSAHRHVIAPDLPGQGDAPEVLV